ncbi:acid protease [Auriscalpium vulgare]|uniref:Acid protease n=1 Tax=Auriscalpium vulgare TaxID=40419 RepID=A0ACB8SCL9_9AGAM|nr:acid protease [Auriscalpium vulgare]
MSVDSTVNDMIYIANITLGGTEYRVQLDTGSSDLWIKGPSSPLPNAEQSSITYNLTYGIGWAYGHVSYATAEFAGINVTKQAFLDVASAQNPALTYGTSGILGLGFTSLSTIDALVNQTSQATGRSLLYNLFADNPSEPNYIAFSLQRSNDPEAEVEGTFLVGETDPQYAAVNDTTPIPTFPLVNPNRWNILLDAVIVGSTVVPVTSVVPNAPTNKAVVLLDSGTSYSYAPSDVCQAIYGNIPGAAYDSALGQWSVPCNAEIDVALQFNGQVFPLHPLDVVPTSLTDTKSCVGSFVPQDISNVGAGNFDWIVGDNFLRSVYSVYDFGDFDSSGNMGNPYIKLLPLVDPNEASADFASVRGSVARDNITYNAANSTGSGRTTVSLSDDITDTLNKVSIYFPALIAVMAFNGFVVLLLAGIAIFWLCRRQGGMSLPRTRRTKGRTTPMPLPLESILVNGRDSVHSGGSPRHQYEPVSMALTDDTFVPPSPAFHGYSDGGTLKAGRQLIDRPKSVA